MKLRDQMILTLICLLWAFNFIAAAKGMQQFSPLVFMVMRFALLLVLTLPFMRKPPSGQWASLMAAALSIGALHFCLLFWAIKRSGDVTSIAIVQQTYVPMTVLLAVLMLGETISWRRLAAIGLAFAGVVILGFDPQVLMQRDALVLALGAAFAMALGSIFMRRVNGVSIMSFQAWTATLSLPLLLLISLLLEQGQMESLRSAESLHFASVAYSTIGASIGGYGLFYFMLQRHPVTTITPYLLMMPLFAVMFGILVWGDRPGWRLLLGGSMILLGILALALRARQKARRTPV